MHRRPAARGGRGQRRFDSVRRREAAASLRSGVQEGTRNRAAGSWLAGGVDSPAFLPEGDGFVFEAERTLYRSSLDAAGAPERLVENAAQAAFARHPRTGAWHIFYVKEDAATGPTLWTSPVATRTGKLLREPLRLLTQVSNSGVSFRYHIASAGGPITWRHARAAVPVWRLRWFDREGNVLSTVGDMGSYFSTVLSPETKPVTRPE
jgi:hypothetical protein